MISAQPSIGPTYDSTHRGGDRRGKKSLGHERPVLRCLPAGDVFFDEVGVLEADEFDREAVLEVTDHPAGGLPDRHAGADLWPVFGRQCTARLRYVDEAHSEIDAVRQDQPGDRIARRHAAVAAVFGRAHEMAV